MRSAALALLLSLPSPALAQAGGSLPWRVVTVASRDEGPRYRPPARFSLSLSLGPGFSRLGFSSTNGGVALTGAAAFASARAVLWLGRSVGVQLGVGGALAVAPSLSASDPALSPGLDGGKASGFGFAGAGVAVGGRWSGLRLSVLGGVAFAWAPVEGAGVRSGEGLGGGALIEVARYWVVDDAWTVGLGATAWALVGRDTLPWLSNEAPGWNVLGGALVASVATR
jgi:hypothetical protein